MKILRILGTRGIPAQHGGYETFAEHLALYLAARDWRVIVYCQEEGEGDIHENNWQNVRLIHVPIKQTGAFGTIIFDWKSTLHAAKSRALILTLGYNTALFCSLYRLKGIKNLINMDGIEWKREKWSVLERAWLYINERCGCLIGNHLIADHPEIKSHLASRTNEDKITMIPYGADRIENADVSLLTPLNITPSEYAIVIARPEPENLILEIVSAFSRKKRNKKLVVLGDYGKADRDYRRKVYEAASDEVVFPGAIYDKSTIATLRYFSCLYIHGHTVGGTNPSLVEAMGAGNPVLAHNNKFNRWVVGSEVRFFNTIDDCADALDELLNNDALLESMRRSSMKNFQERFTWKRILYSYETLLVKYCN